MITDAWSSLAGDHTLRTRRDQAFVAANFGVRRDGGHRWTDTGPDYVRAAREAGLGRLGIDTIDL
ncbi:MULTISPECIES: hypothetical protein [Pseudonocardia]|uniref:Uncharacterized protein n=2 Tax=Pseudonocardia TaxID=1847 RepID=A0A1Y2N3A0_PSEAH|nr:MULTISPECIES: hypothetical protein [Pseudonocardia]OSY41577.1 hypothetical protein BG845_02068 [Pseudonocardia autotrophica]BBG02211.1 hypothetical protein Pdca_34200 [Pseudonocardia autotrophica]GEC24226.1 hypothetical protein PSA01_12550 [Pseudonocardia saturnea]